MMFAVKIYLGLGKGALLATNGQSAAPEGAITLLINQAKIQINTIHPDANPLGIARGFLDLS